MKIITCKQYEALEYIGWGLAKGADESVLVNGYNDQPSLDVTGYSSGEYWGGEGRKFTFLGPDPFGIVPIYRTPDGKQFPADATKYPHLS